MNIRIFFCLFLTSLSTALAQSQVMTYQGRLSASGTNFSGMGRFKFALVSADLSKTFWNNDGSSGEESLAAVTLPVDQGLFTAALGDTALSNMTAIPGSVFANAGVRLRVWFSDGVGAFVALSPPQPLTAAPYALLAAWASNVVGVLPANALGGTYGNSMLFPNSANVFAGSGAGLVNLNGGA